MTEKKVATTREESLKLIELGLDPDTADMDWGYQRENDSQEVAQRMS